MRVEKILKCDGYCACFGGGTVEFRDGHLWDVKEKRNWMRPTSGLLIGQERIAVSLVQEDQEIGLAQWQH